MKAYKRNLLALFALVALIAVGSLYQSDTRNPETPRTRLEWSNRPDNVVLLAALLEERKVDYRFESGTVSVADPAPVAASLADPRVREFWRSKTPPERGPAKILYSEENRLQEKAERVLGAAFGEETFRQVLVRLDYSVERPREIKIERRTLKRSGPPRARKQVSPEEWPLCTPLEGKPFKVAEPVVQIEKLRVLILVEAPKNREAAEATAGFVSRSIGLDETRGDELTLIEVPRSGRLRAVREWASRTSSVEGAE